ncbi:MAG: FTR1 family protein [Desulfurococcales archaeon]|nr:FTR1 family protein [Desulfurococcales archaeon]
MSETILAASSLIGFRESLEVSLFVTIVLVIMKRKGLTKTYSIVAPLGLAVLVGFVLGAIAYEAIELLGESWYVEFASYSIAAAIVLWVISWSYKSAETLVEDIKSSRNIRIIWALIFIFVLREAIEVALMSLPLIARNPPGNAGWDGGRHIRIPGFIAGHLQVWNKNTCR